MGKRKRVKNIGKRAKALLPSYCINNFRKRYTLIFILILMPSFPVAISSRRERRRLWYKFFFSVAIPSRRKGKTFYNNLTKRCSLIFYFYFNAFFSRCDFIAKGNKKAQLILYQALHFIFYFFIKCLLPVAIPSRREERLKL